MTALHRMKAYFGMVPADELDAYDGYDDDRRRDAGRHEPDRYDRYDRYESPRHDDRYRSERSESRYEADRYGADLYEDRRDDARRHEPRYASIGAGRHDDDRGRDGYDSGHDAEIPGARAARRGRGWAENTGPDHTSVRGLGGAPAARSGLSAVASAPAGASPASSASPAASASTSPSGSSTGPAPAGGPRGSAPTTPGGGGPTTRGALAVETSRTPDPEPEPTPAPAAPAEITSLRPTSYNQARVIGENYRDGIPVIMNLTDLDDAAAKRLVDFAAGLAFALRGSIEKVTNRVFLLSPPNVEVSAADRSRLAEGS